jgi:hypothetical protein
VHHTGMHGQLYEKGKVCLEEQARRLEIGVQTVLNEAYCSRRHCFYNKLVFLCSLIIVE